MHNKLCMIEFHVLTFMKHGKMMVKAERDILSQELTHQRHKMTVEMDIL